MQGWSGAYGRGGVGWDDCSSSSWPSWLTPRAAAGEGTTLTRTAADIGAAAGTETIRVIGDLMIAEDVERIVAETEAAFGSIDILVHNAGGNIRAGGAGGHPDPDDAIDIAIAGAPNHPLSLSHLDRGARRPVSPFHPQPSPSWPFCLSHPRAVR